MRVLQELDLLAQRLSSRPWHANDNTVIRRLTRAEWIQIKETKLIPYENAVAVLVVPPLNKNPQTKQRPTPSASPGPIKEEERTLPDKPLPPVSELHYTAPKPFGVPLDVAVKTRQLLPEARVPLYNGLAVFPSRVQRAALYKALNYLLNIERKARWKQTVKLSAKSGEDGPQEESQEKENKRARGDQKASHAYVIFSDARTVLRADTVPLAIALWRIRMWEGQGWDKKTKETTAGGWKILLPRTLPA